MVAFVTFSVLPLVLLAVAASVLRGMLLLDLTDVAADASGT
ncbi:MAG: hypothetical protein PUE51_07740 [Veillonellaceae bacterium]|nr:hypothetical protein [Veillonellaceae bacterium]